MQLPKVKDVHTKDMISNQMVETQEMHCQGCGRFLGLQAIAWGVVKIKCPNCKEWNTIDISPENK
jgi:phage FluMu protein Com